MKFNILDCDDSNWAHYYNELDSKSCDIFYNQNFGKVYQQSIYQKYKIKCAAFECDSGVAIYPFVLRDLIINDEIKINDITIIDKKLFFFVCSGDELSSSLKKSNNPLLSSA